ncbi:MAG: response regulator [Bacilli bacterium]|nr:response regulator [Bacilli bacterium]
MSFLPLLKFYDGTKMYAHGMIVDYLKVQLGLYLLIWFGIVIFNIKRIKEKKYLPIIIIIVLIIANVLLQTYDPSILIATVVATFICYTMYFTIENPDLKMLKQLEIERDRADKANQAKSDFLSSMSHEIRTPLNAITGFSEMIMSSETLEEAQENAKDIISASGTLLETVNGILDISKIESGKIELVEGDYNPYKMIDETVKLARGRLGDKPLDFQVNIAQDIPKVLYGDKFNIKKILINFLTNAIKYTDEGFVRFDVQCVKMNGMVRLIFIVSDSGRGIKKEDISKLFTKFQRLDEEKNQTIEGTGLGLAITKQLIEMMKGTVVVDSVYGEGSKFTFALDQKISDATLDETTQQMDVVVDLSDKKILVVDDNKLNLKVADKLLKLYNVSVTLSNSGEDCISLINDGNKFDLIMLDDMMPKMSGTETLKHLKDIYEFNTPVVALTANAINGMKEKYLEAGFDGYLAKPIVKDELYRTLVRFLNPVSSYEADKDSKVIPTEEVKEEVKEVPIEVKEEFTEVPKVDPQNDIVPRISKVGDIPKYVPDNIEIVVKPGDKQIKEETTEEIKEEPKNDNSDTVILIVDDNNLNIKVETKLITSLGYKVESANSGIEAINKVKSKQYNLIFMDIMMPMMDGVKTLHELQKLQGFDTPVVALTADAVLGAKEKYLAEGFNLYVTKPANKEDFDKIIKGFIK